jgi:hypothetical protein
LKFFIVLMIYLCVPNQDTYYFTLQALLSSTSYSADMINQAASICQKMMLLPLRDHDADVDVDAGVKEYIHLLPPYIDDVTTSKLFQDILTCLGAVPPLRAFRHRIDLEILFMNFHTPLRNQQQFLLKIIETSCQTKLVEKPNVPPHNLIHFVEWVWKNHKYLITTPVCFINMSYCSH